MKHPLDRWILAATLLALAGLVTWLLLGTPLHGIANSGDFERIMAWGGVTYQTESYAEKYFSWVVPGFKYFFPPPLAVGWYPSSEALLVKLAATLGWLFNATRFDLRWLAVVHTAALGAAVALLMRGWRAATGMSPVWLVPGVLLVLADEAYLLYFNSFYSEPATEIFLVAMVGMALWLSRAEGPTTRLIQGFFAAAALLMTAKTQNFALALPLFAFAARLYLAYPGAAWRRLVPRLGGAIVVLAVAQVLVNPPFMTEANRFGAIFNGILKDSPDPHGDLRWLGLPDAYLPLAGHDIFWAADNHPVDITAPAFRQAFFNRLGHRAVATFYLTHPDRLLLKMEATASHAFTLQPGYLGNFEHDAAHPTLDHSARYVTWSAFKEHTLPHTLGFVLGLGTALLALWAAAYASWRSGRRALEFLLALGAMGAIAFVTPVLGDGESDFDKHMYLFNAIFDLGLTLTAGLVLGGVAALLARATGRRPRGEATADAQIGPAAVVSVPPP